MKRLMSSSLSIYHYQHYSEFLRALLDLKKLKNPKFSLRAFSKVLHLSPANLSEIMSGKKKLSLERAQVVMDLLKLNPMEKKYFELLVKKNSTKNKVNRTQIEQQLVNFAPSIEIHRLKKDQFKLIAEWFHFAILVIIELRSFSVIKKTVICRALAISIEQHDAAIERLIRLGLVHIEDGILIRSQKRVLIESDQSSLYIKKFHEKICGLGKNAIRAQGSQTRYSSSDLLTLDRESFTEVKKILDEAQDQIYAIADRSQKTLVLGLSIQGFEVFSTDQV